MEDVTITLPKEGLIMFQTELGVTLVDVDGTEHYFVYQDNGSLDYDGYSVSVKQTDNK